MLGSFKLWQYATRCSDELKSDDKEMSRQLDAARCGDELKSDRKEMSTEDVDAARRSVDAEVEPSPLGHGCL